MCQCGGPDPLLGGTRSLSAGPGVADQADAAGAAGWEQLPRGMVALGRSRCESVKTAAHKKWEYLLWSIACKDSSRLMQDSDIGVQ